MTSKLYVIFSTVGLLACSPSLYVELPIGPLSGGFDLAMISVPAQLQQNGRVASVPCTQASDCPSTSSFMSTCESQLCDPSPSVLEDQLGEVVDFAAALASTPVGGAQVESVSIPSSEVNCATNTTTVALSPIQVFWTPESATSSVSEAGGAMLGQIPVNEGPFQGSLSVDQNGLSLLSAQLRSGVRRFRFWVRTGVDIAPASVLPAGMLSCTVALQFGVRSTARVGL